MIPSLDTGLGSLPCVMNCFDTGFSLQVSDTDFWLLHGLSALVTMRSNACCWPFAVFVIFLLCINIKFHICSFQWIFVMMKLMWVTSRMQTVKIATCNEVDRLILRCRCPGYCKFPGHTGSSFGTDSELADYLPRYLWEDFRPLFENEYRWAVLILSWLV